LGDKIERTEMGGSWSTYGGEEECIQGFGGEAGEKEHFVDLGVDGRIVLRRIFGKWDVGVCTGFS